MKKSRRAILGRALNAAAIGTLVLRTGRSQARPDDFSEIKPAMDITRGGRVAQIVMVVKDAEKVAKQFSDVFGPSWVFYEYRPKALIFHDRAVPQANSNLKIALGQCGGHVFKIVQPISGPTSYGEFLQAQGEGFFGISIGSVEDNNKAADSLKKVGARIGMQGDNGDGSRFTVLDSVEDLGLRVEFASIGATALPSAFRQIGTHAPRKKPIIDMTDPAYAGGKKFGQLGLVVKDMRHCARRYAEFFGIHEWRFQPITILQMAVFGKEIAQAHLPSAGVGQGVAYLGDTQIELLEPMPEGPGGIHKMFFDKHWPGNGFQHLMATPRTADHDASLAALWNEGMTNEIEFHIRLGDYAAPVNLKSPPGHYTGMEEKLGGFVLEY